MRAILAVNAGSSSLKLSLFDADDPSLALLAHETFDGLDRNEDRRSSVVADIPAWGRRSAVACSIVAATHRVVHGGARFAAPVVVDDAVLADLQALAPLAPLHQPLCLAPIAALRRSDPSLMQVACFDTAFHRGRPSAVERYALPERFFHDGIRRYGFHGLSYEYVVSALREAAPELARGRVIVAHLGSGASLCAVRDGKCVDTSMGFSTLGGVPMATRCGELDPGVVLHLLRDGSRSIADVEELLYRESGLRGISGISGDMRVLLADPSAAAREAVDCFVLRISREIGAMTAMLGGLDGLVFTAGIGEHSAAIRERIGIASAWTGLELDRDANARGGACVSSKASKVEAWVIATDEERMMARHAWEVLAMQKR